MHRLLLGSALVFLALGFAPRGQAACQVNPPSLDFSANAGVSIPTQTFTVTNTDTKNGLSVFLLANSNFGLQVSPASFNLGKGGTNSATGTATVSVPNLPAGNYSGSISLTGGCQGVSVTVEISGVNIAVAPASASVSLQQGSRTSTQFVITGGPSAISVSANGQGLNGGSANAPGSFNASVDASNLAPGNYSGTLTFSCVGGSPCVPQVVSVSITVIAPVQLTASPNSISFQAYQGRPAPAAKSLALSAAGGTTSFSAQNVPPWLQVSPANGNISGTATAVTLTLIPSALALGSNTASFSFASGGSMALVSVSATLLKLSLSTNPTALSATVGSGQTTQATPLSIATADNGSVAVTTTATTNRGGSWIKLASTDFTAPGPAPAVTLDATGLATGTYGGTITYSCAPTSQVDCGQTAVPVSLTVTASNLPSISAGGLVVASSFGGLKTIGPGTYVEIYGQNLATSTVGWDKFFVNNVAPTTVQGVGVKINGEAAFVDFVSPGQINALVPGDVSAGPAQVTVSNAQGTSSPFTVTVAPQQPTLLAPASFMVSGKQYVAAFLPPDYASTFALPAGAIAGVTSRPAKPGETLVLYGLGFGAVTPAVPVGTIAPAQVTKLNAPLQILFNQSPGTIAYSGLASGFVGLYQINVQVPQIADSDAVPLTLTLGGTTGTQTLYVAVHQ